MSDLREDIKEAINRHSLENKSNTPDFLLADYLIDCLDAFDKAVRRRENWYGRGPVAADTETARQLGTP